MVFMQCTSIAVVKRADRPPGHDLICCLIKIHISFDNFNIFEGPGPPWPALHERSTITSPKIISLQTSLNNLFQRSLLFVQPDGRKVQIALFFQNIWKTAPWIFLHYSGAYYTLA